MAIKVGIVGGSGYTGVELLRLVLTHPEADLVFITSRKEAGIRVSDGLPSFRRHLDLRFVDPEQAPYEQVDVVFFATPNGVAMQSVPTLLAQGIKVIDLAADFRLKDAKEWENWYGMPHACPEFLDQAVYGLPEINRDLIKGARLVANPGCYPTAVQLGFLPLVEKGWIKLDGLIADAKSGVSGAGRKLDTPYLYSEANENFMAYAVSGHRHHPEICQGLRAVSGNRLDLTFVPHLTPMIRGIHATLYGELTEVAGDLQAIYEQRYAHEYFVDVMPAGSHPQTRTVRASNFCRIALHRPGNGKRVVILAVIDNLFKGAAGQAIQNMNILFGLDETQGLEAVPIVP